MVSPEFSALVLDESDSGVRAEVRDLPLSVLPDHDVLVKVAYSSLNYKDGLALQGKARVVRSYPMIPGIDLAGTVLDSNSRQWKPGDKVVVTGWGLGERHWGGYAQMARVKPEWIVRLPDGLTFHQAMAFGTAGLTAMLAVTALQEHGLVRPDQKVVVTGAGGGVGGMAVALLRALGMSVTASTGRLDLTPYLTRLGADATISREEVATPVDRPLGPNTWDGAVDTVGGATLASLLRSMQPHAAVASCGNAGGNELHTTVLPFILRGVKLLGIDSNYSPIEERRQAWEKIGSTFPLDLLSTMTRTVSLAEVPDLASDILRGRVQGRVIVALP